MPGDIVKAPSWPKVIDVTRRMQAARSAGRTQEQLQCAAERNGLIELCRREVADATPPAPKAEAKPPAPPAPKAEAKPAAPKAKATAKASKKELDRKTEIARASKKTSGAKPKK